MNIKIDKVSDRTVRKAPERESNSIRKKCKKNFEIQVEHCYQPLSRDKKSNWFPNYS